MKRLCLSQTKRSLLNWLLCLWFKTSQTMEVLRWNVGDAHWNGEEQCPYQGTAFPQISERSAQVLISQNLLLCTLTAFQNSYYELFFVLGLNSFLFFSFDFRGDLVKLIQSELNSKFPMDGSILFVVVVFVCFRSLYFS